MENTNKTEGTGVNDWGRDEEINNKDENFSDSKTTGSPIADAMNNTPQLLKKLQENLPFTMMIISVIGYVVIAAFGQMDTFKKYIGYCIFLTLILSTYFLFENNLFKKIKINKVMLFLFLITITVIITQNFQHVITFFNVIILKKVIKI